MSLHSETTSSPDDPPDAPLVAFALTARELSLFLREPNDGLSVPHHRFSEADFAGDVWPERLARIRPTVLVTGWTTPPLPENWIAAPDCPLRYVCHVAGSVRKLVPRLFLQRGGIVTNWGDNVATQVAEHGLLLALSALRNAAHWRAFIARPPATRRIEELATRTLFGRRVGIHGFGAVARALLPLLAPFSVSLSAYSAGVPSELMRAAGVEPRASLAELFKGADVLFECEALTPATAHSVSAEILGALPDDAVFVNIGRGDLVDDAALQREVAAGRLRVALDVVADEPVTRASPYVTSGAVTLSPHIAGPTLDRYPHCGAHALEQLRTFLRGERPAAALSLAAYDRAT
ncbi:MAG TPA: hydroxyacid dehydrogenase [Opitutus sp.]|nr:hydroxyacid dehydrogenase [Opitutus sp.]